MVFREVKTIMFANGYSIKATKGSHVIFYKESCLSVSIPNHNGKDINKKMLKRLFKENNIIIQ